MTDTSLQSEPATLPVRSFGQSVRYVTGYAILIAVMLVSPLFVFLPAALFHCAIKNGRRIAWVALVIGAVLAGAIIVTGANSPQVTVAEANMSVAYLVALILAIALPAMAVLPMVERAESFGRVLLAALLFSAIGLAATEMGMRAVADFSPFADQVAAARVTAAKFITNYQSAGIPSDAIGFLRKWMEIGVYCLPAFLLVDIALVFVLSLVLFGRLRTWRDVIEQRQPNVSSPYLFRNLSLPEWLLFAFVIGGLSPLSSGLTQRVGANVLALVTFLYLLQGLAIFRSFLAAAGAGFAGVLFAYVILGLLTLTGIAPLLLSIAGLFDSFFDFRKFNRKDHSDESHSD
ncbi:MAG TPA: DUF2232 domain-containing protein [Thermoanaerobaculia bacterium]